MSDDSRKGARFDQSVRDFVAFKGFVTKTKIPALTIEAALESRDKANQSAQSADEDEATGRNTWERP